MLNCRTERMLDAAAIERGDRLELVECDRQPPPARLRNASRERKDFLREPGHVLAGAGGWERQGELLGALCVGLDSHLWPDPAQHVAEPRPSLVDSRFDPQDGPRISLEKR